MTKPLPKTPKATKKAHKITLHGQCREDPYHWLRAENWQEVMRDSSLLDPEIRAYLEAENTHAQAFLAPLAPLRQTLFAEMKARVKQQDSSVPQPDGDYAYYVSYVEAGQHPVFCRKPRNLSGPESILLDGNREAESHSYYKIGEMTHSPDHKLVAWSEDTAGAEYYTLRFRNSATGEQLEDQITDTAGDIIWDQATPACFYTKLDKNHRPSKVFHHKLGTPEAQDRLIYNEPDPGFFVSIGQTQSRRFISFNIHDHQTSEIYLIPADHPAGQPAAGHLAGGHPAGGPQLIARRQPGVEYDIEHCGDQFFILTNCDGAEDFKIVTAPIQNPGRQNWLDLIAHKPGTLIHDFILYHQHMVRLESENGLPRIVITGLANNQEHQIAFDQPAYSLGLISGLEFKTTTIRFTYSSPTTPQETWDYNINTRQRTLRKRQEIPSGHDPAHYVVKRIQAPAEDGETVPITLLHHRASPPTPQSPLLLYGYGAYGISIPASFSTTALSLVDRGFVYAIAHIRGGKEKGYRWYRQGRHAHKLNTFNDFLAVARHLIAEDMTSAGNIIAHGGSAGGMLMGAVANMAPKLFAAIIADVPFVDCLNTIADDSLPLTPPEWPEWGNPITSKADYQLIASYAPYENITAKDYPAIFALGALADPRVTYWEPAKWVARLRELKTDSNPLLLHTNMQAGHAGAAGRFDQLEERARIYAFALHAAQKTETLPLPSC